ncbi:histone-lysine N-methyltransferase 2B-like [Polyodon spathula]|uniref:histone-lysine N-methyltransferase 2B-like n=1 Tax=Polyodon spathula TaxID=7913 RepID=UPI001B7F3748|nr:histone-lysine N-methyltransferase 2B-like [Polyodon spathula]
MMAAAGSGSAAGGGLSTAAAARGRFPGRPWGSRSLLRSEKRSQVGRRSVDHGETPAGGARPCSLGVAPNEDPSLIRLLGLAANHCRLRQAGYSSSGSEEGDDFPGFGSDEVIKSPLRSGHRYHRSKAPKTSASVDNFSKQSREKPPPPAPDPGEARTASASKISKKVYSGTLKKGGRVPPSPKQKTALSKPQNKGRTGLKGERAASLPPKATKKGAPSRASQKNKPSSSRANAASGRSPAKPRITIKLAGRKSSRKSSRRVAAAAAGKKPMKKLKVVGFKYVSKAKKLTSKQLPIADVKLKKGKNSADGGLEPEKSKRTRQQRPAQGKKTEVRTEGRKAKPEAKRERERAAKAAGAVPQSAREAGEGGSADLPGGPSDGPAAVVVVTKASKVKRNLKIGKILGLKLKRVRNPEEPGQDSSAPQASDSASSSSSSSSSKRKQNKYVWTLTLVKGKGKATKVLRSAGLKKKKPTGEGEPEEDPAVEGDRGGVVESKPVGSAEDTAERKRGTRQQSLGRRTGKLTEKEVVVAGEPTPDAEASDPDPTPANLAPVPADPEIVEKPLEPLVSSRKKRAARRLSLSVRRKAKARGSKVEPAVGSDAKTVLEPEPSAESDVPRGPTAVGKKRPRRPRSTGRRKARPQQAGSGMEIPSVPALSSPELLDPAVAESPVGAAPTLSPKQRRKRSTAPTKSGGAEPKPESDPADCGAEGPEMQARSTDLILVLDPPVSETRSESAVRNYARKPCRRRRPAARRRRKAEVRLPRAEGEEAASSVPLARQRLAGVVKAKYMRKLPTPFLLAKRPRGRPPSLTKRTQRELAQQLLSNAEKGGDGGSQHPASKDLQRGKSKFLKNIRHFIMPVVSARSSRVIKTPKRFMDDDGMSVLPRKSTPKKPHGRIAREASKEADEGGEGDKEDDDDYQYPEQFSPEVDLSSGDQEAFDLCDRQATGEDPGRGGLDSRLASDAAASPALPCKRRSALREPTFRWSNFDNSAGDVFSLVGKQAFDDSIKLPEVILASPSPKRAASAQMSHRETHLKIYESLKKLTVRAGRRAKVKVKEEVEERPESSPALNLEAAPLDLDDDPEPGHLTLSLPASDRLLQESPEEDLPEKEKLKIEDMDSPGVVRKVAVRLRSPGSELLLGEGSDEAVEEADQSTGSDRVEVEERGTSHKIRLTGANKRMFHLLKRAKVQLIKIDQQKQLKSTQLLLGTLSAGSKEPPGAVKRRKVVRKRKARLESPPQEESAPQEPAPAGPRIKHVCRDAAVVLGQPRAMVPDDVPRLSALPLHERDGIAASPRAEDTASASEPEAAPPPDPRPVKMKRSSGGRCFQYGKRNVRCGTCKGCLHQLDCGECVNCLDKPKFGGPNTKRQCCVFKKCDEIEERKQMRLGYRNNRSLPLKRRRSSASACPTSDDDDEAGVAAELRMPDSRSPSLRTQPRRCAKQRSYCSLLESDDSELEMLLAASHSTSPGRRRASGHRGDFASLDGSGRGGDSEESGSRLRRVNIPRNLQGRRKPDKSQLDQTPPSVLAALVNGFTRREKEPSSPVHKIRVDFKEDCNLRNTWLMGGLSILASVPVMPQYACLLCASKGQHEMLHCQVCCEPFHRFCLDPGERPLEDNEENWCCRRCKFCHVCGRKSKHSKPLLECERCQNSYHPACLGPNYPKPNKRKKSWVCMTCIRCKSCGVTPGKSWDLEWNHDTSLCPDCTKLYEQGNYCTICSKCYEDNDYETQMIQCAKCNHWVHAKCEGLSDELYEILSSLPESVLYSCRPCSEGQPSPWREALSSELQAGIKNVLLGLLSSRLTLHLLRCRECSEVTECDSGFEGSLACDLQAVGKKFDKGLYTSVKAFHDDVVHVIRTHLEEEAKLPPEERRTSLARSFYLKLLESFFCWFNAQDPKAWDPCSKTLPNGILPNAVLPPSAEHMYAQWREREGQHTPAEPRAAAPDLKPDPTSTPRWTPLHRSEGRAARDKPKGRRGRPPLVEPDTSWSKEDQRQCCLCLKYGDDRANDAGRLLYLGQNEWAHVNCSLWSAEVFEEEGGALMNVHAAVARGRQMRCEKCHQPGATVGCCLTSCQGNYHFMCARSRNCVFQEDRKVYCQRHRELTSGKTVSGEGFQVLRRVYVDFEGISLKRKFLTGLEPESISMMIGSLQIVKLGVLTELSVYQGKLIPVGYQCSRWYWSTLDPRRRCKYTCRVTEVRPTAVEKPVEETPEQGDNHTIAHSPSATPDPAPEREMPPPVETPSSLLAPVSKPESGARIKISGYSQTRRPAGGLYRPLPSPGSAQSKSHHIPTVSDLDETTITRRPRRHSPLSHHAAPRGRMASPPLGGSTPHSSGPITLRAGALHSKAAGLSPYESPVTSPQSRSGSRSTSSMIVLGSTASAISAHLSTSESPLHGWQGGSPKAGGGGLCFSPLGPGSQLPKPKPFDSEFGILHQDSPEVPHDFLEPSDTDLAGANGSASSPDHAGPGQEARIVCEQDFPYAPHFDVESVLNVAEDLEFDESLLNDDLALHCGAHIVVGEVAENQDPDFGSGCAGSNQKRALIRGRPQGGAEDWGNSSSDEDMDNYYDFTRTVVAHGPPKEAGEVAAAAEPPSLGAISQLDGVDDGTESDASVAPATDGSKTSKTVAGSSAEQKAPGLAGFLDDVETSFQPSNGLEKEQQCGEPQCPMSTVSATAALVESTEAAAGTPDHLKAPPGTAASEEVASHPKLGSPSSAEVCAMDPAQESSPSSSDAPSKALEDPVLGDSTSKEAPSESVDLQTTVKSAKALAPLDTSSSSLLPEAPKDVFLDPSSGHFVSAEDGSLVSFETPERSASLSLGADCSDPPKDGSLSCAQLSVAPPEASSTCSSVPVTQLYLTATAPPKISTGPVTQASAVLLKASHVPQTTAASVVPPGRATHSPVILGSKDHLKPAPAIRALVTPPAPQTTQPLQSPLPRGLVCVSTASSVTLASYSQLSLPIFSSHSVPPGTPAVTIVSSAHAGVQSPEVKRREVALCQPVRPAAPILINGYGSAVPVSREQQQPAPAPRGRVISLNLSTPQPQATAPALSGHTLLTVREVGGQNPDSNPQVLLVNKFGQIFVKNPTDNTFHLPGANSPSLSFIGQIKSLLQSNALASTLAASGNLSAMGGGQAAHHSPLSPVGFRAAAAPAAVAASSSPLVQRLAAGQGPATRYIAYSSSGGGAPSIEDLQKAPKQPKRASPLKASVSLTKPKPASVSVCQSNLGQLYVQSQPTPPPGPIGVPSWTVRDPMMNLLPAVNLVAGRSTGMWSPPPPSMAPNMGPRILSATSSSGPLFRVPPALSRADTLKPSAPGLLEPIPFALAALQRPRTQVRIKRVSSLSDRIAIKKSKMDLEPVESAGLLENIQHAVSGFTASSKLCRVRMKTPTVKGVLDLDKPRGERLSDSENVGPAPWDSMSARLPDPKNERLRDWHGVGRSSLTDWTKYSGAASSSDEEGLFPDPEEEGGASAKDRPHLRFEIKSEDGFHIQADSIEVAWRAVVDRVQEARAAARLKQLSFAGVSGVRMLGMLHDAVLFLVEQLFGANLCSRHKFCFHKQEDLEEELPINPSGCARAEVYLRKSTFDMFNFLASQHRQLPDIVACDEEEDEVPLKSTRRATSLELPMAMRFRHLERSSKEAVGVYRSAIHGRGLFCKRSIDAGEMVIEYSGIVIRSVLTDKREKYYDSKGIGCYMFRIDDFDVVDATMHGNAARFINHSCEPNCYSRVINVEGQKHIVIFATRTIYRGEELTYDYKFPIEDASSKLHCNCGAKRCRHFLN